VERAGLQNRLWLWIGAGLALIDALIHLLEISDGFEDAAYEGVLFIAAVVGGVVVTAALLRGLRGGWLLGGVLSVGMLTAYLVSRTAGLPAIPRQPFCLPGLVSLAAEGLFVFVAARSLLAQPGREAVDLPDAA